jgi:pilus assembly protein CpaC
MNGAKLMAFSRLGYSALVASMATLMWLSPHAEAASKKPTRLTMESGDQHVLALRGEVARVATADEKIVGVNVAPPSGVVLTGKAPGTAMVSIWEQGRSMPSTQFRVTVTPALSAAKDGLGADAQLAKVDMLGSSLRMSGEFNSLERHAITSDALGAARASDNGAGASASASAGGDAISKPRVIDSSKSAFDVQVQLDVKVVEVSRNKLKSAGFYADRTSGGVQRGLSAPSNLSGFVDSTATGKTLTSGSGFVPKADAFNIFLWGANSLTVFSALESNGFAYTLAEPSLTALSGQTATFLAGGELPIPLRTGSGSDSSISVTFKQFGIRLSMTPTVLDANRLVVQLAPEVSEIDESLSITAGGLTLPGLRVRRTETTVATGDGETFVISGLVSQHTASAVDKFPILGDIPILGAFFRSNRFSRDDRELLMIVTPHLVRPFAKEAKLPSLPGEEVKDFDPGYLRFLFLENGKFTQPDSGFSR